jgi:hypothetical protein
MGSAREEGGRGLKSLSGPKLPFGQKTEFGKWSMFHGFAIADDLTRNNCLMASLQRTT